MTSNNKRRELIWKKFNIKFDDSEYVKYFVLESMNFYKYNDQPMCLIPEEVILSWLNFIEECEEGYSGVPPEFDNDLNIVREDVDAMIASEILKKFPDHNIFCSAILQLDKRFDQLTFQTDQMPGEWNWWRGRILKRAGEEYANFMNSNLGGIRVEIIK